MNAADVVAALGLPPESRVERRIAKKLLAEQGVDAGGVVEARWLAALKPATAGIAAAADAEEIQVLWVSVSPDGEPARLAAQLHRAVPYPVFLVLEQGGTATIALADGGESLPACPLADDALTRAWLPSLALAAQPSTDLAAVYRGWIAAAEALRAARVTGALAPAAEPERRRHALDEHARLGREIARLRALAAREKQLNRRVELNLQLKKLESELAVTRARM